MLLHAVIIYAIKSHMTKLISKNFAIPNKNSLVAGLWQSDYK